MNSFVQSLARAMVRKDISRPSNFGALSPNTNTPKATPSLAANDAKVPSLAESDDMPKMFGSIGEEIAHDLTQAINLIQKASNNPQTAAASLSQTHYLIEALCRKAISMQQIARLTQERAPDTNEPVPLQDVTKLVLDERLAENSSKGVVITSRYKPVNVIADLGLLLSLISAGLDWVSEFGAVIRLSTGIKSWPQHGQLTLTALQGVRLHSDNVKTSGVEHSIAWHLLQQTAAALDVALEISQTDKERTLVIEFPRTLVPKESMSLLELDNDNHVKEGFIDANNPSTIAGSQVLLISTDLRFYDQVRDICKNLSLVCDRVPSVDRAERACELTVPHLIMCEEDLASEQFDQLIDDLHRHNPGFATIMVSTEGYGFELSDWSGLNKSRVSRTQIDTQLPPALIRELTRAF